MWREIQQASDYAGDWCGYMIMLMTTLKPPFRVAQAQYTFSKPTLLDISSATCGMILVLFVYTTQPTNLNVMCRYEVHCFAWMLVSHVYWCTFVLASHAVACNWCYFGTCLVWSLEELSFLYMFAVTETLVPRALAMPWFVWVQGVQEFGLKFWTWESHRTCQSAESRDWG